MKVVVVNKTPFNTVTYDNVTNISYSDGTVIIYNGNNHTYNINNVKIMIV